MTEPAPPAHFGPYRVVRELGASRLGGRWIALNERTGETRVLHRVTWCRDAVERRRVTDALSEVGALSHPHLLTVEQFWLDGSGQAWCVTDYRGNQLGLVSVDEVAAAKDGRLSVAECDRSLEQLLSGVSAAHGAGVLHGPVRGGEVLVDRHGSVWIELYGLARRVEGLEGSDEMVVRDEVRSIAALGYRLMTGLDAEEPRMAPSRVLKKLDRAWDRWFDRALDAAGGFDSAREALDALPGRGGTPETPDVSTRPVRRVLARFRRAPNAG